MATPTTLVSAPRRRFRVGRALAFFLIAALLLVLGSARLVLLHGARCPAPTGRNPEGFRALPAR